MKKMLTLLLALCLCLGAFAAPASAQEHPGILALLVRRFRV